MKRLSLVLVIVVALVAMGLLGCTQSAPPAPTQAPAVPTKAVEPTKPVAAAPAPTKAAEPTKAPAAPTAAPTAAPAKKVDYPEKGKTLILVVPYPPGGGSTSAANLLVPGLEAELGISVQILNKGGAGTQIGLTDLVRAKPDGYTLLQADFPVTITIYSDPGRAAVFGRKDFVPVAHHVTDPMAMAVLPNSPYKTLKDMVDDAKARPNTVKVSTTGPLSVQNLQIVTLEQQTGAKFAQVAFDGGGPAMTAILGGHIDGALQGVGPILPHAKGGALRVIGAFGPGPAIKEFLPDVKTAEEFGYKGLFGQTRGWVAPAGTPKDIVDILTRAIKKVMDSDAYKSKIRDTGHAGAYMDPAAFSKYWDDQERDIKPVLELAIKQSKQQ